MTPNPNRTHLNSVITSRSHRRRRVSSLVPVSLLPTPSSIVKTNPAVIPPLIAARLIKIKAAEARGPTVPDETNTYPYPVIVVWRGKYFPVFPGSVDHGGRLMNGRLAAAKMNEPLLSTALWAKRPAWEMYEAIKGILSAGWGYNNSKDEYVLNIWGYHEETTLLTTLDDICKQYFRTQVDGSKRRGPLVLGFRPYAWAKRD
ncbi:uncharacterized protein LAJ45_04507 [Morchella importuna]|uniref:uncharacterized protein n=1 Tax=Morchella importuna TaxID=1174673 RepID=UPI001E8EA004|nr:uncharacterized protein LAJ45_04507 [Morchella importuna]KAH8151305.1 hypothetical protein LAJ45_04507 [Morchella importuna]